MAAGLRLPRNRYGKQNKSETTRNKTKQSKTKRQHWEIPVAVSEESNRVRVVVTNQSMKRCLDSDILTVLIGCYDRTHSSQLIIVRCIIHVSTSSTSPSFVLICLVHFPFFSSFFLIIYAFARLSPTPCLLHYLTIIINISNSLCLLL